MENVLQILWLICHHRKNVLLGFPPIPSSILIGMLEFFMLIDNNNADAISITPSLGVCRFLGEQKYS